MLYPMDVLRTKLQASAQTSSPLTVLRQTWHFGGLRALYAGLALPLSAQAVYKGTVFTVHNVTQEWVRDFKLLEGQKLGRLKARDTVQLNTMDTAVCGFCAGAVNAGAFVTPVELVRNQVSTLYGCVDWFVGLL